MHNFNDMTQRALQVHTVHCIHPFKIRKINPKFTVKIFSFSIANQRLMLFPKIGQNLLFSSFLLYFSFVSFQCKKEKNRKGWKQCIDMDSFFCVFCVHRHMNYYLVSTTGIAVNGEWVKTQRAPQKIIYYCSIAESGFHSFVHLFIHWNSSRESWLCLWMWIRIQLFSHMVLISSIGKRIRIF